MSVSPQAIYHLVLAWREPCFNNEKIENQTDDHFSTVNYAKLNSYPN